MKIVNQNTSSKGMHIALYVVQFALAGMFGMAGFMKTITPVEELAKNMAWVNDTGAGLVRFIGFAELLGALGLILPSVLRIQPKLSAYAGACLALVMLLAMMYHAMMAEYNLIPVNVIIGGACLFVAWGRLNKAPIAAKQG
jgi:putative oxidoreductase